MYVEEGFGRRAGRRKRAWERSRGWRPKRAGKGSGLSLEGEARSDARREGGKDGGTLMESRTEAHLAESHKDVGVTSKELVCVKSVESGPVPEPALEFEPEPGPEPAHEPVWVEMEVVKFPRNPTLVLCCPVAGGKGVPMRLAPMRLVYVGWAAHFKLGAKLRVIPGGLGFRDVWQLKSIDLPTSS